MPIARAGVDLHADEDFGIPIALTPGLLITLAVVVLVLLAVASLVAWRIWRAVHRSGALERGLLQMRAAGASGPTQELAALRLRLRDSLVQTSRVLQTLPGLDAGRLAELNRRLQAIGDDLDAELRLLEREPDRDYLTRILPSLRTRVGQLLTGSIGLRETAMGLGDAFAIEDPTQLEQDISDEISSLKDAVTEVRSIQGLPPQS